ncbi:mannitol dehydrogenase family protein [Treponema sp.]
MKNAEHLSEKNLDSISNKVIKPSYDRKAVDIGIAHFGVGGFHRAHQALYTEEVLASGDLRWGICGIGITDRDKLMYDALKSQDYLYSLIARGVDSEEARIIGSIIDYKISANSTKSIFDVLSSPATKIISLTITEKAYPYKAESQEIDLDDLRIQQDIKNIDEPKTVIGYLVKALNQIRHNKDQIPPTILCCDNVPQNGDMLRNLVSGLAHEIDCGLESYIRDRVLFPNTMVDRITPTTSAKHTLDFQEKYGIIDNHPVFCEDFRQWIVENKFTKERPEWELGGARFVESAKPYEKMKIRLLNGSHSALAYLSYLIGFKYVDDAVLDLDVQGFVKGYMNEITPSVGKVPGIDLSEYKNKLVERFSNSAIKDTVIRLAEDGSRKIPNMIVEPLVDLLSSKLPTNHVAFALACWIRFLEGDDESKAHIEIVDPLKDLLTEKAQLCKNNAVPFLSTKQLFPESVSKNEAFANTVSRYLNEIRSKGSRAALRQFLQECK